MTRSGSAVRWLFLFLVVLPALGCSRIGLDAPALDRAVQFRPGDHQVRGSFEVSTKATFAVWGLVPLKEVDLAALLRDEIGRHRGDAVSNLRIDTKTTFGDGLITVVALLGLIYSPRSVIVSGDVVSLSGMSNAEPQSEARVELVAGAAGDHLQVAGLVGPSTKLRLDPGAARLLASREVVR